VAGFGVGEVVGLASGFDDGAVEGEPVDDGGAEPGIGAGVASFAEGGVGGDRDAVLFLAFGQDLEEHFGAAAVEFEVGQLIDAEQVDASVAGDGLGELFLVGGLDQFVDEFGGQGVLDPGIRPWPPWCRAR
jgi:hypothetical protein